MKEKIELYQEVLELEPGSKVFFSPGPPAEPKWTGQ